MEREDSRETRESRWRLGRRKREEETMVAAQITSRQPSMPRQGKKEALWSGVGSGGLGLC
jgi:hypothetical protein